MRFARTVVSVAFAAFLIFRPTFFFARMKSIPPWFLLLMPFVFFPIGPERAERARPETRRARRGDNVGGGDAARKVV